jgi:hypothetical protein
MMTAHTAKEWAHLLEWIPGSMNLHTYPATRLLTLTDYRSFHHSRLRTAEDVAYIAEEELADARLGLDDLVQPCLPLEQFLQPYNFSPETLTRLRTSETMESEFCRVVRELKPADHKAFSEQMLDVLERDGQVKQEYDQLRRTFDAQLQEKTRAFHQSQLILATQRFHVRRHNQSAAFDQEDGFSAYVMRILLPLGIQLEWLYSSARHDWNTLILRACGQVVQDEQNLKTTLGGIFPTQQAHLIELSNLVESKEGESLGELIRRSNWWQTSSLDPFWSVYGLSTTPFMGNPEARFQTYYTLLKTLQTQQAPLARLVEFTQVMCIHLIWNATFQ